MEADLDGEGADRSPADGKLIDKSQGFKLMLQSYLGSPRPEDQKVVVKNIRFFKEGEADSEFKKTDVVVETAHAVTKNEVRVNFILLFVILIFIVIILVLIYQLIFIRKQHEKENRQLAMELHDSAAQQMYYVSMLAEKIADEELAKEIKTNQSECIENIRNICFTLSSQEMNKISFVEELKSTIERFEKRTKINTKLVITPEADFDFLKKADFQHILKIFSELLTNIEKHSDAEEVTVLIRAPAVNDKIDKGLVIYISDDGKGIDEKLLKKMNSKKLAGIKNRHYGIQNIKLRLKKIGGSIKYVSEAGEGTEVEIQIAK